MKSLFAFFSLEKSCLFLAFVLLFEMPVVAQTTSNDNHICGLYYYVTESGDSLTKIAWKLTGNANRWEEILDYNEKKVGNADKLKAGTTLLIPPAFIKKPCDSLATLDIKLFALVSGTDEFTDKKIPDIAHSTSSNNPSLVAKKDTLDSAMALRSLFAKAKMLKEAEQEEKRLIQKPKQARLEIDGLILDETRSKIGKDFFDIFYQAWVNPKNTNGFTIRIIEKPVPGLGSQIEVKVNETLAYQSRLQPKADAIEMSSKEAVQYAMYYLQNQPSLIIY